MIRHAVIPWCLLLAGPAAAESLDLLRFTNGDQFHGAFRGIKEGPLAVWQRDDLTAPVNFKTTRIRHIVLHGGRPLKPLTSLSHLGLVNGDRVPGTITGIDGDTITLDTSYAGELRLPRGQVAMLAPNPLGGRVYYHGPFVENEWKMAHAAWPDGFPAAASAAAAPDAPVAAELPGRWVFSGSAWYWNNKHAGTALIREAGMPDRAVLRFDLAWKNRPCLAIAFHADFAPARPKDGADHKRLKAGGFMPGDVSVLPRLFGNSYVLQMYADYLMLYRTAVSAAGQSSFEQVQMNNNNLRLMDSGKAQVEVRSNRRSGAISLFINDEFVAQWNENKASGHDGTAFAGKGGGFGFVVQGEDSPVRISDIVVAEWNGMPDSARSMQVEDQDVVLMANGTDRCAGKLGGLDAQGIITFEGKFGRLHFPLDEVAEIRFARNRLAAAADEPAERLVVRFAPLGSISGSPLPGDGSNLGLLNPSAGPLRLSLDSAVMLDFNSSNQFIDDWNADF